MSGIRERKKQRTQREILRCSEVLFVRQGYQATTMEEIAEAALVGVGTLYNYFGGKGDLLAAIMTARTEEVLAASACHLADQHTDAVDAVADLLFTYACGFLSVDMALMRELMSQALASPDTVGKRLLALDERLTGRLAELLARLQGEGLVAPAVDPQQASFVLYAQAITHLMLWTQQGAPDEPMVRQQIRDMVQLVFRPWLPTLPEPEGEPA